MLIAAATLGGLAVLWAGVRSRAALLLCVCLAGWLLSEGDPVTPPDMLTKRVAPVRERVHEYSAGLEARWRCDIATRLALANGSEEAIALAERSCPSAGDPLPED
jgi:hypothetical protein